MVSDRPQGRRWLPRDGGSRGLSLPPGSLCLELTLLSRSAPSPTANYGSISVFSGSYLGTSYQQALGNAAAQPRKMCRTLHIAHIPALVEGIPMNRRPTNPLAFFPFSRVLSSG